MLTGALPLLQKQNETDLSDISPTDDGTASTEVPLGARIIRTVRAYDLLVETRVGHDPADSTGLSSEQAIDVLRKDTVVGHNAAVLDALETSITMKACGRIHATVLAG